MRRISSRSPPETPRDEIAQFNQRIELLLSDVPHGFSWLNVADVSLQAVGAHQAVLPIYTAS